MCTLPKTCDSPLALRPILLASRRVLTSYSDPHTIRAMTAPEEADAHYRRQQKLTEGESTHRRGFFEGLVGKRLNISLMEGQFLDTNNRSEFFRSPEGIGLRWATNIVDTLAKQYGFRAHAEARGQDFLATDENGLVINAIDYGITLTQPLFGSSEPTRSRLTSLYGDLLWTAERFELYHPEGAESLNPPPAFGEKFVDKAIEGLTNELVKIGVLKPVQL